MHLVLKYKIALLLIAIYILTSHVALRIISLRSRENVEAGFGNRSLLVIAHPDDETMFFGPTILNLIKSDKFLVILCLSDGNGENLGSKREKELGEVVHSLGEKVTLKLVKDSQLPDDTNIDWNISRVADHIENSAVDSSIDTIITFDYYGVSGHNNHRAIYRATKFLLNKHLDLRLDILILKSVSLFRKYTFFLDSVITLMANDLIDLKNKQTITLGINLSEHSRLRKTLNFHQSQMVWFRKLYMLFSRYMFINDLERIS